MKTEKINDIYDTILTVKEELDREIAQDDDSTIEDPKIVEYITKHFNNFYPKINPKDKRNFRKNVKEMCEKIMAEDKTPQ